MPPNARNAVEEKLVETLEDYFEAVKQAKDSDIDLQPFFHRLDVLAKTLPPSAHPQLRHYLQQKSYRKAHQFLLGGDPEAGTCGR